MKRRLSVLLLLILLLYVGERTTNDNDDARVLDDDTAANLVPNWKARDMANVLAMMVRPIS